MNYIFYILLSLVLLSACQSSETHSLSCSESGIVTFEAPQPCHHLSLSLLSSCNNGLLHLYSDRKMLNLEYELKDIKDNMVIYEGDWYSKELGVEYVSEDGTIDGEVKLRAVFYYN